MKGTIVTLLIGAVVVGLVIGSVVFYVAVPPRTVISTSYSTRTITSTVVTTYTYTYTSNTSCQLAFCVYIFSITTNSISTYPVSYGNATITISY